MIPNTDPWISSGAYTFGISQQYETAADQSGLATITVGGSLPVNSFASGLRAPFVPLQGLTNPTGGSISGGISCWAAIVAKNVANTAFFGLTPPSELCRIDIPAGTDTNSVTIPQLQWAPGSSGYIVYAGTDPSNLTYQDEQDTNPSQIVLTGPLRDRQWGMPDVEFRQLRLKAKKVEFSGVVTTPLTGVSPISLSVDAAMWTANQWAGYDCSVLGLHSTTGELPVANFTIAQNTSDTLSLTLGSGNPVALGVSVGDVLVIRSKPSSFTASSLADANWDNSLNTGSLQAVSSVSTTVPPVLQIPAHGLQTGDRIRIDGFGVADGIYSITVADSDHVSLVGGASLSFVTGASIRKLNGGFAPGSLAGKLLRFIAGTGVGQVVRINANTTTSLSIEGQFQTLPDGSSRYIIEDPSWLVTTDSSTIDQYYAGMQSQWIVRCDNLAGQVLLVQALSLNGQGQEAADALAPVREIYLFGGSGGTAAFTGGVALSVSGILAIGSDLAPPLSFLQGIRAKQIRLTAKQAPTGSDLVVQLYLNGAWYATVPIPAGTVTNSTTTATTNLLPNIEAGSVVRLDITQVGTQFPGADLTCSIFT